MATFKFKYSSNIGETVSSPYLVNSPQPLDVRTIVNSTTDLYDPSTWVVKDGRRQIKMAYPGLLVSVNSLDGSINELYMCLIENPSTAECWRKISPSDIKWENDIDFGEVSLDDLVTPGEENQEQNNDDQGEQTPNEEPIVE